MRKNFIYAAVLSVFLLTGGSLAFAKSANQTTTGFINGTYNCLLAGGFLAQPDSKALLQFTVDGKGNVTATPGEFNVTVAQHSTSSTPVNNEFLTSQYIYQICDYSPSGGSYALNATGTGTLSINWISHGTDPSGGADCSENITTDYAVVISSAASFAVNSTDLNTSCGAPGIDYASCGSSFTGTCQLQSGKL
jgi:hypothetical protein